MKALISCLKQFAFGVMFLTLAVVPFHLLVIDASNPTRTN